MLRPLLALAAVGAIGFVVWQFLWTLILPLVGVVLGFLAIALKFAFFGVILFFLWKLVRKLADEKA